MYCGHCGCEIDDNSIFCDNCGARVSSTEYTDKMEGTYTERNRKVFGKTGFMIFIVLLVCIIVGLAAVLNHLKKNNAYYSLKEQIGEKAQAVLNSLDKDVVIYVYVDDDDKNIIIDEMLQNYESWSEFITIQYINPDNYPTFIQYYTDEMGAENSLIIVSDEISRVIDYDDLVEYLCNEASGAQLTTNYVGSYIEKEVISAIEYVVWDCDIEPVIYYVTGHDESEIGEDFIAAVKEENMIMKSLNLMNSETIPEDTSVLIINSPKSDFEKSETQKVVKYLLAGGKALITCGPNTQNMTNFQSILEVYGVSVVPGVIYEYDSDYTPYSEPLEMIPVVEDTNYSCLSKNLRVYIAGCIGYDYSSTVNSINGNNHQISYINILKTSDSAVSKTDELYRAILEYEGPFIIAAAVEQMTENEKGYTQIVLIGTRLFLNDDYNLEMSGANVLLFMDILNELIY